MLIVDAFNVLHASRDLAGVADLLERLEFGRYAGRDVTLVCDGSVGTRDPHEQALITRRLSGSRSRRVLYAGPHREADDLIEELLHEAREASRVTLVSSDRRLRSAAARVGASCIASRDFLRDLQEDLARRTRGASSPGPFLDRASVERWMTEFGVSAGGEPLPPRPRASWALPDQPTRAAHRRSPPTTNAVPTPFTGIPDLDLFGPDQEAQPLTPDDLDMERWLRRHPPPSRP